MAGGGLRIGWGWGAGWTASVANVSLIVAIDKAQLVERVGKVTARKLERVLAGVDVVLGR